MFTRFVCDLLGFLAREFPTKPLKNLDIYFSGRIDMLHLGKSWYICTIAKRHKDNCWFWLMVLTVLLWNCKSGYVKRSEVESYDSLRYPSKWGGGKLLAPQVPWHLKNTNFVEYACRIVCVYLVQDTALSKSIYFIALRPGPLWGFCSVCVSLCFSKLSSSLATGYRLLITGLYTLYINHV